MALVIANWKMKLGIDDSLALAKALKRLRVGDQKVVVCPSFVSLTDVGGVLKGTKIALGAQDCFWESEGAFTGEISAKQIRQVGCQYVIIGHSERRHVLKETDEMIHKKIRMAVSAGLTPIVCVGETFDERQNGAKDYILIQQTTRALQGIEIDSAQQIIIAYEPVWVIGSGQAIEPAEAESTHQVIRQTLFDLFPATVVNSNIHIVYGGSVDADNVAGFTGLAHTSGVLVGGASLNVDAFAAIIKNA